MNQIEIHTKYKNLSSEKNRCVSVLVGFVFSTNTEAITQHTGKSLKQRFIKQVVPIQ